MAAAYRAMDRIHAPLFSPLEDINTATAHLKLHWPSSSQRLQETFLQSSFQTGTDYTTANLHSTGTDDLIILNAYKTNDTSPAWGLGPSPLSPLYLFYPVPHLNDRSLPSPQKPSRLFPQRKQHPPAPRANTIQFFLDRKDFTTSLSSTTTCVLFHEEFVSWRLADRCVRPRDDSFLGLLPFPRLGFKRAASSEVARSAGDMPAARIFVGPTIRAVDQRRLRTLVGLFTSAGDGMPVYTTIEEGAGETGVKVFYGVEEGKKAYWWVWENRSWRVVFDAVERTSVKSKREEMSEMIRRKGKVEGGGSLGFRGRFRKVNEVVNGGIAAGTAKLYSAHQSEPVALLELATGQMWVVKGIVLGTLDVAVAVMLAVINLEMAIKTEHEQATVNESSFLGFSF